MLYLCDRSDDANKAFSAAVQMHDTLVKAWALWGDYLEGIFTKDRSVANWMTLTLLVIGLFHKANTSH
jgi:hypothetical protein